MEHLAQRSSVEALADLMRGRQTLVLSGAGISTESGIPDYRGPQSAAWRTQPISYREFISDPSSRARYWARSAVGWPRVSAARPNAGHAALADMERAGALCGVITQNVDGLHRAAGSRRVLELHGSLAEVVCLQCGTRESRQDLQGRILSLNPGWAEGPFRQAAILPDGDALVDVPQDGSFLIPACLRCTGMLKPDVTFFGENVPRARVEQALAMLADSEMLLVLGSSLAVYSGYRFVVQAVQDAKPVAIINRGSGRGDPLATVRVEAALGEALPRLASMLVSA
ncbi:MAG: NAD-dependent protein deacetylase [Spirochaetia bacterium]|jgi:NAD-dependent SIR2 family protein deacetylase